MLWPGIALLGLMGWLWREVALRYRFERQLHQKVVEQCKVVKAKATAATIKEWQKMWTAVLEEEYGIWSHAQNREGKLIWEKFIIQLKDMKQYQGLTAFQVAHIRRLVVLAKRAALEQDRTAASLTPVGEIEFDGEGGFRVK